MSRQPSLFDGAAAPAASADDVDSPASMFGEPESGVRTVLPARALPSRWKLALLSVPFVIVLAAWTWWGSGHRSAGDASRVNGAQLASSITVASVASPPVTVEGKVLALAPGAATITTPAPQDVASAAQPAPVKAEPAASGIREQADPGRPPRRSERESVAHRHPQQKHGVRTASASVHPSRSPSSAKDDADVMLIDAMLAHLAPDDAVHGSQTIARLVAQCDSQQGKSQASACRRRICDGYWGRDDACPAPAARRR